MHNRCPAAVRWGCAGAVCPQDGLWILVAQVPGRREAGHSPAPAVGGPRERLSGAPSSIEGPRQKLFGSCKKLTRQVPETTPVSDYWRSAPQLRAAPSAPQRPRGLEEHAASSIRRYRAAVAGRRL